MRAAVSDGEMIEELVREARSAWPEIDLDLTVFASYLAGRLPDRADGELAVRRMRTSDLYLACACARGDARAVAAFERCYLGPVGDALARTLGLDPDCTADVKQQLRRDLLIGDGSPKLLQYSGRGDLRRWLRVLAVREAIDQKRRTRRETPSEDKLLERALLSGENPETEYFKRLYQGEFADSVAEAILALSDRDRTLLRQSFVDGLGIDAIGRFHGVHRATAARWLARAQKILSRQTRAVLMRRLKVQPAELPSILRFIRSGLEMSLRAVFPAYGPARGADLAEEPSS